MQIAEIRIRTRTAPDELALKRGKIALQSDWMLQLTGPCKVYRPDGKPLCVYLPGHMQKYADDEHVYSILHSLRSIKSGNRGLAGGTIAMQHGTQKRRYAVPVSTSIIGAIEDVSVFKYCRLTAWTGANLPQWEYLQSMLQHVAGALQTYVPARYAAQAAAAAATLPAWVVPGTPFTTITVNNTFPTGYHTDKGDLDAGFSAIACLRKGTYAGGELCFPEYKVAVDMQHGDLLLMDAHDWHGNAAIICACDKAVKTLCKNCQAERISVVSYFRTKMTKCGTPEEQLQKARDLLETKV
jgi:Oxygenase domain of the 2OGFeDO superfamily